MWLKLQIFFALAIAFLVSCRRVNNDLEVAEATQIVETIAYKTIVGIDENLLSLDIYYTDNITDIKPIVIWVHGGGWSIGDKTNNITDKANLFRSNDWLFISLNYRLSPFPFELTNPDRIKYPDHNNDIADAIKWVYDNIEDYGGDKNNIVLLGHSAGAHLVSLTGTNRSFIESRDIPFSIIKGIASIDTEGYDINRGVTLDSELYINAFGTVTSENIDASPTLNVTNGDTYPNFFIAKRGEDSRVAIADAFIAALEAQDVSVDQVDGSIYTHTEINEAIGLEGEILVTEPLIQFMKESFD